MTEATGKVSHKGNAIVSRSSKRESKGKDASDNRSVGATYVLQIVPLQQSTEVREPAGQVSHRSTAIVSRSSKWESKGKDVFDD